MWDTQVIQRQSAATVVSKPNHRQMHLRHDVNSLSTNTHPMNHQSSAKNKLLTGIRNKVFNSKFLIKSYQKLHFSVHFVSHYYYEVFLIHYKMWSCWFSPIFSFFSNVLKTGIKQPENYVTQIWVCKFDIDMLKIVKFVSYIWKVIRVERELKGWKIQFFSLVCLVEMMEILQEKNKIFPFIAW